MFAALQIGIQDTAGTIGDKSLQDMHLALLAYKHNVNQE